MEHDISYEVEDEAQFWQEIDDIVHPISTDAEAIRNIVNNFISFVSQFGADYLAHDADVETCCDKLLESEFYKNHAEGVREAMIDYKPEVENIPKCYVNLYLLLLDGHHNSRTFKLMRRANMIPIIAKISREQQTEGPRFTRLGLTILYEMCRMQKLSQADLEAFDEEYIWFLLRTIEMAHDDEDPYSYRAIKVIVSLNGQFMVAALPHAQQPYPRSPSNASLPLLTETAETIIQPQNSVVKVLSSHGSRFKAFGENLIRMLNRERDASLQLLILKQLFLLFTNPTTYEYFYTNDLHVLVDVFIRELYNLPAEDESLRHTYLRVLHPLLTHTQLRNPPYYKSAELISLLNSLNQECSHFGPVGATTVRLLARCLTVPWLLPPRRRKLKLPRPNFDKRKSSKTLGMSLAETEKSSKLSVKSIDSVNSIAKVRPPTTPRIKPAPRSKPTDNESAMGGQGLEPVREQPTVHNTAASDPALNKFPATTSQQSGGPAAFKGTAEELLHTQKHNDLLREIHKLELTA